MSAILWSARIAGALGASFASVVVAATAVGSSQDQARAVADAIRLLGTRDPVERFNMDPAAHPSGAPIAFANLLQFRDALDCRELVTAVLALPISKELRQSLLECAAKEFPSFVERHDEIRKSHQAAYLEACSSLADRMAEVGTGREREAGLRQVERLRSALARELERTEQDFLDTIVDCIGDGVAIGAPASRAEHAAMLEGLSLRAQRRWHREGVPSVRWADFDLRRELETVELVQQERAAIELRLLELERFVGSRQQDRCRLYWSSLPRLNRGLAQAENGERDVENAEATAQRGFRAQVEVAKQMRTQSQECLEAIMTSCTPEHADAIRSRIQQVVYPELYPDADAGRAQDAFSQRLSALDPASEESRVLREDWLAWKSAYDALCRTIERDFLAWTDLEASLAPEHDPQTRIEFVDQLKRKRAVITRSAME